jgi:hypothetical protein
MTHIVPPIQGIEGSWADLYKVTCDGPAAQSGRLPPVGCAAESMRSIMRCLVLSAEKCRYHVCWEAGMDLTSTISRRGDIVDLILRVNEGDGIDVSELAEPDRTNVVDLMAAQKKSLAQEAAEGL